MTINRNLADLARSAASIDPVAVSGQLQAVGSASLTDMVIFGPAVDGVAWGERTQATTSDLMVAMIQDNGSPNDTQLRVFDLSAGAVVLPTPIVDLRLTGVDSATCIAACMGYIAIGSEDGVTIVDPHDGTWKEREDGYPRSLSVSDVGSGVDKICAGFSDAYKYDPRTGGQLPVFGGVFTSSSWRALQRRRSDMERQGRHFWRREGVCHRERPFPLQHRDDHEPPSVCYT